MMTFVEVFILLLSILMVLSIFKYSDRKLILFYGTISMTILILILTMKPMIVSLPEWVKTIIAYVGVMSLMMVLVTGLTMMVIWLDKLNKRDRDFYKR